MVVEVQKWDNRQGLRLTRQLLLDAQLYVGDEVDVAVHDGLIVVEFLKRRRGRGNLRDLVKQIPEDHQPREADWGAPAGEEVW